MEAAQLGVSTSTLGRMIFNVIIDALVGAVPMFGDLFDVAWTANKYNINLLEDYLKSPGEKKKANQAFIIFLFAGLLLLAIILILIPIVIMRTILNIFIGS